MQAPEPNPWLRGDPCACIRMLLTFFWPSSFSVTAKEANEVQVQNQSPIRRPRTLPKSGFRAQSPKSDSELDFEVQVQTKARSELDFEVQVQVQLEMDFEVQVQPQVRPVPPEFEVQVQVQVQSELDFEVHVQDQSSTRRGTAKRRNLGVSYFAHNGLYVLQLAPALGGSAGADRGGRSTTVYS
jgi:hypothetical protein